MRGMKLQFSTSTLLLITAAIAIACASLIAWTQIYQSLFPRPDISVFYSMEVAIAIGPVWLPVAFAALAIGRRRLTVWMVIALAVGELVLMGASYLAMVHLKT